MYVGERGYKLELYVQGATRKNLTQYWDGD